MESSQTSLIRASLIRMPHNPNTLPGNLFYYFLFTVIQYSACFTIRTHVNGYQAVRINESWLHICWVMVIEQPCKNGSSLCEISRCSSDEPLWNVFSNFVSIDVWHFMDHRLMLSIYSIKFEAHRFTLPWRFNTWGIKAPWGGGTSLSSMGNWEFVAKVCMVVSVVGAKHRNGWGRWCYWSEHHHGYFRVLRPYNNH